MKNKNILKILSILGPGWIVMMADIDAPSVFTALVTGSLFGLSLFWLIIGLIIPLYFVQEASARLSLVTGKGFGKLIKENYGKFSSFISIAVMVIINSIGFVGEFAGVAAGGLIFNVPIWFSVLLVLIFHTYIIFSGSYKKVENILIYISSILLIFLIGAILSRPSIETIKTIVSTPEFQNITFLTIILGNIGAVIMPWMIFYQGNALVDSGRTIESLKIERKETLIGSIFSEILVLAIMVISASFFYEKLNDNLNIMLLSSIFSPYLGTISPYIFAIGIIGAGLLAGIVISLSSAWSIGDYFNIPNSLNCNITKARTFYIFYIVEIVPAAFITLLFPDLINLMIEAMVLNTVLLPIILFFLIRLTSNERLMGKFKNEKYREFILWLTLILIVFSILFTIYVYFI
ncbi:MAG: divalent metal cation transporter [Thermoplasmata archaeon]